MSKLRLVVYRDLQRIAERSGFEWVRSSGSHNVFRNTEGRIVVIPNHGSQVIVRPLLRKLLRDFGISIQQYNEILDTL